MKIEQQEEKYLEDKIIVIRGNLSAFNSEKYHSASFKFWVLKSSEILMKLETYSADGNMVDSLETQKLEKSIHIK